MTDLPQLSDHFDGRRFFNPGVDTDKTFADIWRWRRTAQRSLWPAARANAVLAPPPPAADPGTVAVTFIGHASMLVTTARRRLLFDPVFSERVSPLSFAGPRRVRPPGLALAALPPLDLVLVSHNHYDHLDLPSLRALRHRPGRGGAPAPVLTGLGNAAFLARAGIPGAAELDWWQAAQPGEDLRVTFVPAQHWSSRTLLDRRRTLWGGFLIETDGLRLYFAGDSGYCPWFTEIARRFGPPDLAILPIGAYAPRWFMKSQHMDPAEAVQAHLDLGARTSIGMHFGTVQLTDEGIDDPPAELARARHAASLPAETFVTLDVGETRTFRFA